MDIDAGADLVEAIKPLARSTMRDGVVSGLGGFGALFDLRASGYQDPILVASTDGVGTKLKVAIATGVHHSVGIDLVAMCVNDLVVQGAEPLFFLDYYGTGKLTVSTGREIVAGIAEGCRQAGCALIGGETAELPGLYADGDYDLAGFAVGAAERGRILTGETAADGDVILGLASDGLHSNGFSLVRKVVEAMGLDYQDPSPFRPDCTLGATLLAPTRIYVKSCLAALQTGGVKALAHITGGGLVDNIPRVLPSHVSAEIDATAWRLPEVFSLDRRSGRRRSRGNGADLQLWHRHDCRRRPRPSNRSSSGIRTGRRNRVRAGPAGPAPKRGCASDASGGETSVGKLKTAVLISGRGSNLQSLIDACADETFPAEIVLVISNVAGVAGLHRAERVGIPTTVVDHKAFENRDSFENALHEALIASGTELVCLAGFMRILTDGFVNRWWDKLINIHPSLLPAFRGLHVHERVIEYGARFTGCTVHMVRPAMDDGPIIVQAVVPVLANEDPDSLAARVLAQEHRIYPLAVRLIAESKVRVTGTRAHVSSPSPVDGAMINPAPN